VASSGPNTATPITPSVNEFCVSTPSPLLVPYSGRARAFLGDRYK